MSTNEIIMPTKEEVIKLLNIVINDKLFHMQTISELLGMKMVDSLLPKIKGEPEWGYEGLKMFFINQSIKFSCTIKEALEKLNT